MFQMKALFYQPNDSIAAPHSCNQGKFVNSKVSEIDKNLSQELNVVAYDSVSGIVKDQWTFSEKNIWQSNLS